MTGDHFMATLCRLDVFLLFTFSALYFLEYYLELAYIRCIHFVCFWLSIN